MEFLPRYECNYCHYDFGYQKPKLNSPCPGCGHVISGFITIPAEVRKPGFGLAILMALLALAIPIFPGLAAMMIARKTDSSAARVVCWIAIAINLLQFIVILYAWIF